MMVNCQDRVNRQAGILTYQGGRFKNFFSYCKGRGTAEIINAFPESIAS